MARDRAAEGGTPLRLFVAIDIPQDVRVVVASAAEPLRHANPRGRWVPLANQHVTLKFLGSTRPRLVDRVTEAIEDVAVGGSPFETRVDGLGAFPNERRARVLWAGLEDAGGRMAELAGALDESLRRDVPPEKRPFTPHLTLARFDPPAALGDLPHVSTDAFAVDRVILFRSHLRRPAPVYERLATLRLGG